MKEHERMDEREAGRPAGAVAGPTPDRRPVAAVPRGRKALNRPIFVFGCPRSGTTMLSLMLHAHSGIAMPPETRFLLATFRARESFGDLEQIENRRQLAQFIVGRPASRFGDLGLPRRLVRRRIAVGPPSVGSAVGTVFRSYADSHGKPRWGDKFPTYYRNVDAITAMFPRAQFVHLIRDGRDCAASLKRMPWWQRDGKDVVDAIAFWCEAVDRGCRARASLPADSYYELQYEGLVTEPEPELRRLCDFLGEPFEQSMLESHLVAHAIPERQSWHANTRREVTDERVGGYSEGLEPWELRLVEYVAGSRLRRLGYDVPESPGFPRLSALLRYWYVSARLRFATAGRARRDRKIAGPQGSMRDLVPQRVMSRRRRQRQARLGAEARSKDEKASGPAPSPEVDAAVPTTSG
jgi:hypothetical protein